MIAAYLIKDDRTLSPGAPERWHVEYEGELIVTRSRDPEHDACRALLARGVRGRVAFIHAATGTAGLLVDIARGAGRTTVDGPTGTPRARNWRPNPWDVPSPAREKGSEGPEIAARVEAAQ